MDTTYYRVGTRIFGLLALFFIAGLFTYSLIDGHFKDANEVLGVASILIFVIIRAGLAPCVKISGDWALIVQPWTVQAIERFSYVAANEDRGGLILEAVGQEVPVFAFSGSWIALVSGDRPKRRLIRHLSRWSDAGETTQEQSLRPQPGPWGVIKQLVVITAGGQILALLLQL